MNVISIVAWAVALAVAVSWPGRVIGPLDGAPFDVWTEALLFAMVLPALCWFHPVFLRTTRARVLIVLLLAWKIGGAIAVPQGGWCGDFLMANPPASGGWRLTRSWDARTIWERTPPACSAIVARGYARPTQFPAWMMNIPFGFDRWLGAGEFRRDSGEALALPEENPRPPAGEYRLLVHGALTVGTPGTLSFETAQDTSLTGVVDAETVSGAAGAPVAVALAAGQHQIDLQLDLTRRAWKFVPLWNGSDLFSSAVTTIAPVNAVVVFVHRAGRWIAPLLVIALLTVWTLSAATLYRPGVTIIATTAAVAALLAWAGTAGDTSTAARLAVAALAAGLVIPVPARLRNARGAFLFIGIPWLAMIAARAISTVGRYTLYLAGDDAQTYQRFAYRIYMERFWLEGGQKTFWNQPLYRWICGALHLLFGDSSAGEIVWDGFGLLVGAMFAYVAANRIAGFRVGMAAAVAVLLTVALGPNWYLIGRGLTEISALMWIYVAGICLIAADEPSIGFAVLAGAFATLGFYTRMNHLPLVIALGALTLHTTLDAGSAYHPRRLWARLPWRAAGAYYATLAVGLCAFAARTWHYTGAFSLFAGTSLGFNAIGLGTTLASWGSRAAWGRALSSVLMLVTVQDPPRFDWRSTLVIVGFCASLLALAGVPMARRLPLGLVLVCVAAVAGGLVVRGSAYPGRFSLHLIPIAVTVSVLMMARLRQAVA